MVMRLSSGPFQMSVHPLRHHDGWRNDTYGLFLSSFKIPFYDLDRTFPSHDTSSLGGKRNGRTVGIKLPG